MNPDEFHYGNELIQFLKDNQQYGGFFNYQQYQKLKQCRTAEEFHSLVRKTKYRELTVTDSIKETFLDLLIIDEALRGESRNASVSEFLITFNIINFFIAIYLAITNRFTGFQKRRIRKNREYYQASKEEAETRFLTEKNQVKPF